MPTDRSLNRVKKISRSRFGQQTLHKPKKKSHCSLQEKTQITQPTKGRPPQGGGTPKSAGRNRFKVGSGINGILPAGRAPAIYSVPRLSRLRPALRR